MTSPSEPRGTFEYLFRKVCRDPDADPEVAAWTIFMGALLFAWPFLLYGVGQVAVWTLDFLRWLQLY